MIIIPKTNVKQSYFTENILIKEPYITELPPEEGTVKQFTNFLTNPKTIYKVLNAAPLSNHSPPNKGRYQKYSSVLMGTPYKVYEHDKILYSSINLSGNLGELLNSINLKFNSQYTHIFIKRYVRNRFCLAPIKEPTEFTGNSQLTLFLDPYTKYNTKIIFQNLVSKKCVSHIIDRNSVYLWDENFLKNWRYYIPTHKRRRYSTFNSYLERLISVTFLRL